MKQHLINLLRFFIISLILMQSNLSATDTQKHTMIFFHITHCSYCEKIQAKTFQKIHIKESISKNFNLLDINVDDKDIVLFHGKKYTKKKFAKELDVNFFPTVLFLSAKGEINYRVKGYRDIEQFQYILNYIITRAYQEMSFFDYLEYSKIDKE